MPKENLSGKNLDHANLAGSDLSEADLSNTSLRRSRLTGAKLAKANLAGSDLHGAHLEHADLTGADLTDADLTNADLRGVDLARAARLDGVRLAGARGVSGDLASLAHKRTDPVCVARLLDHVADLNREIDRAVRAPYRQRGAEPTDDDRQVVIDTILAIRARRDVLEDAIVADIEDGMALHPGSTVDDR